MNWLFLVLLFFPVNDSDQGCCETLPMVCFEPNSVVPISHRDELSVWDVVDTRELISIFRDYKLQTPELKIRVVGYCDVLELLNGKSAIAAERAQFIMQLINDSVATDVAVEAIYSPEQSGDLLFDSLEEIQDFSHQELDEEGRAKLEFARQLNRAVRFEILKQ
ncbi:hypothetical protein [Sanyastnella coralliicola]|uniref:hypothetical protein n=1 Tax=Sanyastnella coralliicola TaxID=3069118 RepID=UPI0027BAE894|nr:hypothetical protein [Longitalea sp. SCSIO 12813]